MKTKIPHLIAGCIFIICVPLMALSAGIAWAVNSHWLYERGFEKYDVTYTTGLELSELNRAADGLISYFNSGEEYINIQVEKNGESFELFNEREKIHLKDVKSLFQLDYTILIITLAYMVLYSLFYLGYRHGLHRQRMVWSILGGSGLTIALLVILAIGAATSFQQLFVQFHLLSFSNQYWILDPSRDYLIMLFPEGFWFDAAMYIGMIASGIAVVMGGITGSIFFFMRMQHLMKEEEERRKALKTEEQ